MIFFSPLEQFSINAIIPLYLGVFDFSITNSTIITFLACTQAITFYNFACFQAKLIPNASQTMFE